MKSSVFWKLAGLLITLIIGIFGWIFRENVQQVFAPKPVAQDTQSVAPEKTGVARTMSFEGRLKEAARLTDREHYSLAALELAAAMKQNPEELDPYLLLAEIYLRTQNITKLDHLTRAIAHRFPESTAPLTLQLRSLISQKDFSASLSFIDTLGDEAPREIYFYEAVLRGFQNDHAAARDLLPQVLSADVDESTREKATALQELYTRFDGFAEGENPHLFALLSKTLSEHNEAILALEAAELAVKEDIEYPDGWILRGYAKFLLHEYDVALEDLRHAYELDPLRPETHYFLALVLQESGQIEEASLFFEKSLEHKFAFQQDVKWKLAELFTTQKKYDRVVEIYQELLSEESATLPKESVVTLLHNSINIMKKPELALEISGKLLAEHPQEIFYLNMHGWSQIANKHFNKAAETLQRATYLEADNPRTLLNQGLLAEEQQQFSQAKEFYKKSYQQGQDQAYESVVNLAADRYNALLKQEDRPEAPSAPNRPESSP